MSDDEKLPGRAWGWDWQGDQIDRLSYERLRKAMKLFGLFPHEHENENSMRDRLRSILGNRGTLSCITNYAKLAIFFESPYAEGTYPLEVRESRGIVYILACIPDPILHATIERLRMSKRVSERVREHLRRLTRNVGVGIAVLLRAPGFDGDALESEWRLGLHGQHDQE